MKMKTHIERDWLICKDIDDTYDCRTLHATTYCMRVVKKDLIGEKENATCSDCLAKVGIREKGIYPGGENQC